MKYYCSYEENLDEDFEYEEDYIDDDDDGIGDYYQGYDDDDYQNPDSEYDDE